MGFYPLLLIAIFEKLNKLNESEIHKKKTWILSLNFIYADDISRLLINFL